MRASSSPETFVDRLAHDDHVAAVDRGDTKADRQVTVIAQHAVGRLDVASANVGDVAQVNGGAEVAAAQQKAFHLLDRRECAGGIDGNELGTDLHAARVGNDVLLLQPVDDGMGMYAELGHSIPVGFYIDGFVTLAP